MSISTRREPRHSPVERHMDLAMNPSTVYHTGCYGAGNSDQLPFTVVRIAVPFPSQTGVLDALTT